MIKLLFFPVLFLFLSHFSASFSTTDKKFVRHCVDVSVRGLLNFHHLLSAGQAGPLVEQSVAQGEHSSPTHCLFNTAEATTNTGKSRQRRPTKETKWKTHTKKSIRSAGFSCEHRAEWKCDDPRKCDHFTIKLNVRLLPHTVLRCRFQSKIISQQTIKNGKI